MDELSLTLKPSQAAEVKLDMKKAAKVTYKWVARGGGMVNFDTHGDSATAPAVGHHGYGKGRQSTGDEGALTAAFDGNHGGYWRNRSKEDAVLRLTTQGAYSAVKRVLYFSSYRVFSRPLVWHSPWARLVLGVSPPSLQEGQRWCSSSMTKACACSRAPDAAPD